MPFAQPAVASEGARLMAPLTLRGLTLRNRVVVSPMCTYSATEGMLDDFHLVHLGRFALGGAGLVFVEATAVSRRGRITHGCAGLWTDEQIEPLRRVAAFTHRFGAAIGLQLSHSGHKGSSRRPWEGLGPIGAADIARGDEPWEPQGATASPFDTGWAVPAAMSTEDVATVTGEFAAAARRADHASVDVVEVHCAHGYLLHSFLSPLSNTREDAYSGDLAGRMRFPLEVVEAVREAWPREKPLFVRISSVDGIGVGWSLEESITFARELKARGVDVVDCSSGGQKLERAQNFLWRGPGFHVPFAEAVRREADIPTVAVGLIRDPDQAEAILADGKADLVAFAREALFEPNLAGRYALALESEAGWDLWPEQLGWWLLRRARQEKDGYGPRREGMTTRSGTMRKIVHLHKRQGGEVEAFHAAIAESARGDDLIPGLASYVQSHTLVRGYAKGELLFDAVEEFAFADPDEAAASQGSEAYRDMEARRRSLVDGSRSLAMTVDVHRVKDTPVPAGAVKNIEFVNRRPGMELGAFRRYWLDMHGPIGSRIPSILRYEQNHLARETYEGAEPRYDGLAITWFESTAAMREGAQSEAYEITRADEANFLPDGHLPIIITREVLFR